MYRRAFGTVLGIAFYLAATDPTPSFSTGSSSSQALEQLDLLVEAVEELRSTVDRSQFDLEALLATLDFEAQEISDFVGLEIGFEQYPGLLRGAKGTLMSRAGNSLDQAVLLATLLNDAGFEARIHRGRLDSAEAARLLGQMTQLRPSYPPALTGDRVESALERLAKISPDQNGNVVTSNRGTERSRRGVTDTATKLADEHSHLVFEVLEREGIQLGDPDSREALVDETADYFWVTYRDQVSDGWTHLHPAFGSDLPPEVETSTVYSGEIPTEFQHRIRLDSKISQELAGKKRFQSLMSSWERPAANLTGVRLSYFNLPNGFAAFRTSSPEGYEDILRATTLYSPTLQGSTPPGAKDFDLLGNAVDSSAARSMMAGVFETVSSGFASAAEGLVSGKSPSSQNDQAKSQLVGLNEHWIEVTLIAPNGHEEVIQRTLASRGEDDLLFKSDLSQVVHLNVTTGGLPPAFVLDQVLGNIVSLASTVPQMLYDQPVDPDHESRPSAESQIPISDLFYLRLSQDGHLLSPQTFGYLSEPSVTARYQNVNLHGRVFRGFDILNNTRRAFSYLEDSLAPDPEALVRWGVWDTVSEYLAATTNGKTVLSTITAFEELTSQAPSGTIQVLSNPDQLARLQLQSREEKLLASDLESGFSIIRSSRANSSTKFSGWWRVNTESGETLGIVSPIGWGALSEEQIAQLIGWAACSANVYKKCLDDLTMLDATNAILTLDGTSRKVGASKISELLLTIADGLENPAGPGSFDPSVFIRGVANAWDYYTASYIHDRAKAKREAAFKCWVETIEEACPEDGDYSN